MMMSHSDIGWCDPDAVLYTGRRFLKGPITSTDPMEVVVQILKHLPPGWPRIVAVLVLALLFFFPDMRRLLAREFHDKERFGQAKKLLELRKLELTVVDLKARHPQAQNVSIDSQIEALLSEPQREAKAAKSLVWIDRFKLTMAGSLTLMLMGTIALWHSDKLADGNLGKFLLTEFGLAALSGALASAIPCRYRWECVFRGFMIPALLAALAVAAKGSM